MADRRKGRFGMAAKDENPVSRGKEINANHESR